MATSQQDSGFFDISIKSLLKSLGGSEYSTHIGCCCWNGKQMRDVVGALSRQQILQCTDRAYFVCVPVCVGGGWE